MKHYNTAYDNVSFLKRRCATLPVHSSTVATRYPVPPKLPMAKYNDLITMTNGMMPVIRHQDHQSFYRSLPH